MHEADPEKASLADRRIAMAMSMAILSAIPRVTRRATRVDGARRVRVSLIPCRQHWDFQPHRAGEVRVVAKASVADRVMHDAVTARVQRAIRGLLIASVPACLSAVGRAAEEDPGSGYPPSAQGATKISN